jgi:colanic acid/amylovoran biosynthesis glycosyltransferase
MEEGDDTMDSKKCGLRVGYVLKVFPRISETFILNEILELERQGIEIDIFSLKPPTDPRYHGDLSRLRATATYLPAGEGSEGWRQIRSAWPPADVNPSRIGQAFLQALLMQDPAAPKLFTQALVLAGAIRKRGIQHLHAHFATSATSVAMMAAELAAITFSFTAHAKDIYHRSVDRDSVALAMKQAAFVVTVTDHNVSSLLDLAPACGDKVRRIYNGMSLECLQPAPWDVGYPPLIVSVGRLIEKKGFPYLVEACRLLKYRRRSFRCVIVGAGDKEQELRALIERLNVAEEVVLAGAMEHEAVLETIRRSTVTVLPCIVGEDGNRDALPTVLLEAMALGRPVVSTDLPGVTEIVDHGVNGFLVPQRDSRALAEALETVLEKPELQVSLGRASRTKAEGAFDLTRNVSVLAGLFGKAALPTVEQASVEAVGRASRVSSQGAVPIR